MKDSPRRDTGLMHPSLRSGTIKLRTCACALRGRGRAPRARNARQIINTTPVRPFMWHNRCIPGIGQTAFGASGSETAMQVKGGRLELLVPHMLRGQLLRPGFVRLSLRLGLTRQMPAWAKLQFTNNGITAADLDFVLGRITSLESWVDEWESLGRAHEQAGHDALSLGKTAQAGQRYLWASAAYNFAQYVVFMDPARKKRLHEMCVAAYGRACPRASPPAREFVVEFRRRLVKGALRLPPGEGPFPVVVIFNGTNGVKEELHCWSDAYLERGIATVMLDGPGLGQTFH